VYSQIEFHFVKKRPGTTMSRASSLTLGSRYLLSTDDLITIKEFKEKLSSAGERALLDADEVLFDGVRPTFVGHVPAFWIKAAHGNGISYIQQAGGSDDDTTEKLVMDWSDARAATMHVVVFLVSTVFSAVFSAARFSVCIRFTIGLGACAVRRRRRSYRPRLIQVRRARTRRVLLLPTACHLPAPRSSSSSLRVRRLQCLSFVCAICLRIANYACMCATVRSGAETAPEGGRQRR
jgi:hypothetical protein